MSSQAVVEEVSSTTTDAQGNVIVETTKTFADGTTEKTKETTKSNGNKVVEVTKADAAVRAAPVQSAPVSAPAMLTTTTTSNRKIVIPTNNQPQPDGCCNCCQGTGSRVCLGVSLGISAFVCVVSWILFFVLLGWLWIVTGSASGLAVIVLGIVMCSTGNCCGPNHSPPTTTTTTAMLVEP